MEFLFQPCLLPSVAPTLPPPSLFLFLSGIMVCGVTGTLCSPALNLRNIDMQLYGTERMTQF